MEENEVMVQERGVEDTMNPPAAVDDYDMQEYQSDDGGAGLGLFVGLVGLGALGVFGVKKVLNKIKAKKEAKAVRDDAIEQLLIRIRRIEEAAGIQGESETETLEEELETLEAEEVTETVTEKPNKKGRK